MFVVISSYTGIPEYGRSDDTWYLQWTAQHLCLFRLDQNNNTHEIGRTSSLYHAENLARSVSGRSSLKFVPYPFLHPVLPLWGAPRLHEKAALRVLVAKTKRTKADQDLAHRRDLAHVSSVVFGTALDCVSWDAIHRFQHSSSRQRLLYYRIKGHRLSGWDRLNDRRGCPRCVEIGSAGGSVFHTVWDCASTQTLWNILRTVFTSLGLWKERLATSNDDFLTAVFSLKLPCIPPKIWELPSLRKCRPDDDDTGDGPYPVLQAIWQQLVLGTLVGIHAWRTNVNYAPRTWSTQQAEAVHNINCRRVLDTLQYRLDRDTDTPPYAASILSRFKTLLESPDDTTVHIAELTGPARALLFGGSPGGQPGPRGVGAFVVASSAAEPLPAVHCSSATWIAEPTTTQHQANYRG